MGMKDGQKNSKESDFLMFNFIIKNIFFKLKLIRILYIFKLYNFSKKKLVKRIY